MFLPLKWLSIGGQNIATKVKQKLLLLFWKFEKLFDTRKLEEEEVVGISGPVNFAHLLNTKCPKSIEFQLEDFELLHLKLLSTPSHKPVNHNKKGGNKGGHQH